MDAKHTSPGFSITHGKGFHITFENGFTVSVQFGGGNYCSNYDLAVGSGRSGEDLPRSSTAELAAWGADGSWLQLEEGDDVVGYQSPADVLAALVKVAAIAKAEA